MLAEFIPSNFKTNSRTLLVINLIGYIVSLYKCMIIDIMLNSKLTDHEQILYIQTNLSQLINSITPLLVDMQKKTPTM